MHYFSINLIFVIILFAAFWGVIGYLIYLLIKALRKYIRSEPVRREKSESARSLGEVLKKAPHRVQDDAGVCGRGNRCEPPIRLKVGERSIRPQHDKSYSPCKTLWFDRRGAAAGNAVTKAYTSQIKQRQGDLSLLSHLLLFFIRNHHLRRSQMRRREICAEARSG